MNRKVLIINLTRFGDLLQTQPLLSSLAAQNFETGLVCLENFAGALPMMRGIDDVWPLSGARILARLNSDWPKALRYLTDFVSETRAKGAYSHIINLTLTTPARLLARMLAKNGAKVLGFDMDDEGFGYFSGSWAALFAATATTRLGSPFNVADIFRMTALPLLNETGSHADSGKLSPPSQDARGWAGAWLAKYPFARAKENLVAFQLGASNPARQWPVENFVALGTALSAKGYHPLLLGTASEKDLADAFSAAAPFEHINACGQTDIPQLAALLENCRLLVTNDTGTMHLASGLSVPILAFFLATAQPWDTAPYSAGNCCLEPAMACHPCSFDEDCGRSGECLKRIRPEFAVSLSLAFLENGNWQSGVTQAMRESVRVWQTAEDACGFAALVPLSGHQKEDRAAWLAWQRWFWRQTLDEMDERKSACQAAAPDIPVSSEYIEAAVSSLFNAAASMESLAGAVDLVGKNPRAGKMLLAACEKIQAVIDFSERLQVLGAFWRLLRNESMDMPLFGRQMAVLAKNMKNFAHKLAEAKELNH